MGVHYLQEVDELNYHSHDMFKLQTFISFFIQIIWKAVFIHSEEHMTNSSNSSKKKSAGSCVFNSVFDLWYYMYLVAVVVFALL